MKNRFESDYNQRLADSKKAEDEKYNREEKIKEDKRIKNKNDFYNTNKRIMEQKNEAKKSDYKQNVEFENKINDKIRQIVRVLIRHHHQWFLTQQAQYLTHRQHSTQCVAISILMATQYGHAATFKEGAQRAALPISHNVIEH